MALGIDQPGLLLRIGENGNLGDDTLAVFQVLRPPDQMRRRASFIERTATGVLLYSEEAGQPRLIETGCSGVRTREIAIDSIGPPDRVRPAPRSGTVGRLGVRPAEAPFPGGIALVGGRTVWATLNLSIEGEVRDSSTSILVFDGVERVGQVVLNGWYQLFDARDDGLLLFGNADGLYPSVLVVDGLSLLNSARF